MTASAQLYFDMLGVSPSATMDEVNTAYYLALEKFPVNPTEEQAKEQQRLQHAYGVLLKVVQVRKAKRRRWVAAGVPALIGAAGVAVLAGAAMLVLNLGSLKLQVTSFDTGDILRFEAHEVPYGEVLGFESAHQFSSGVPSAAYHLRLADGTDAEIWLSERVVEKGMVRIASTVTTPPAETADTQAAGVE